MKKRKLLFIDRDGTLIEESADQQVDSLQKIRFLPDVIPSLLRLKRAGYEFVLVSNQDGVGTASFPETDFKEAHNHVMQVLASQGIEFVAEKICPHFAKDKCTCRKPALGLVEEFLDDTNVDLSLAAVIGDRETDMQLADNMGVRGLRVNGAASWPQIADGLLSNGARRAQVNRKTNETNIAVDVDLDNADSISINTGIGFFDHMLEQLARHGGFSLQLACKGDLHIDEHHTVEDCALTLGAALNKALGDKRGMGRYGFVLPMDESLAEVAIDVGGRSYAVFKGSFSREHVGGLPTELVPHFFRSLGESLGAAIHIKVQGENSHHMVEAVFKSTGRALRSCFSLVGGDIPSTKGVI